MALKDDVIRAGGVLWSMRRRKLLLAVAISGTLAASWQPGLLGLAAFMTVSSPLEASDFILPLYHDGDSISAAVADLHRRGLARKLLLHRREPGRLQALGLVPPAHEIWRRLLEARGIAADDIQILDATVSGERQLGRVMAGASGNGDALRVIVVASAPMSRLSHGALRDGAGRTSIDIRMHPVMPRHIHEPEWWRSKSGWLAYFDAYCLWLLRWVR